MKRVSILIRKLSVQIESILSENVGSDIRLQRLWFPINPSNFGLFGVILKSTTSKILSCDER